MATEETYQQLEAAMLEYDEPVDRVKFDFVPTRREFVQVLGAGLLLTVCLSSTDAQTPPGGQRRGGGGGRGGGRPTPLAARLHIAKDGTITVLTGKVECGQGARAEITQAAAEELRVPAGRVILVMADTALVPNDGITAGSGSTPRTLPAIRQAAAAARNMLVELASKKFGAKPDEFDVNDGKVIHKESKREQSYADLAAAEDAAKLFAEAVPANVTVTPIKEWKVMGKPMSRPNGHDIVTGAHHYPSDISRPGMLHGKVLRPPSYGAKATNIDLASAKAMKDVSVVQDGSFIGVAAPTTFAAEKAIEEIAKNAKWDPASHPSSKELYDYLRQKARGGVPNNPFADDLAKAAKALKQTYNVAYVQHSPMEPRAAVAEWADGKLTVWTSTQNPFGVRGELANAFRIPEDRVRVIVPDFGGGFGGKHSGETAVEAARLAQAAGKPVSLRWTREEEFTWAYFRPAAVIDAQAGLDASGSITSWHFININSGGSAVESPYRIAKKRSQYIASEAPLRHGSYRALASTANNFARESFMDELADAAGKNPLEFRLAHLEDSRLRAVLEEAAKQFNFTERWKQKGPNTGIGLACGTEKGSFVAACCEISVDKDEGKIAVKKVAQAYECGAIINPANLKAQVTGAIIMGLGPALREEMKFSGGKMLNAAFSRYLVPRMEDVPQLDIHLLNRPDLPSVGAGETPIICIAPAIANAIFHATGQRIRQMPIKLG
ncbi:MAG TPA: molybdopterin cofactor-binding domain-containing protein [Tepidisphaeraceae bacterium]|jgi:isoquinoline 1-oxidoreductase|nr:molybdopterin cofactor-binding domain-containing protein [Tepidisphaeraceae bacterium]